MGKKKAKESKEMARTALVRDRFFYFFEIPYYISKDFFHYFVSSWNGFFGARDRIKAAKEEKDNAIAAMNIDSLVDALEEATADYIEDAEMMEDIIEEMTNNTQPTLEKAVADFSALLQEIITEQNNYDWYSASI